MNERIKFISAYLEGAESFSELCERFKISRKTGYKWVERYEAGGVKNFEEKSRSPRSHPNAVDDDIKQLFIAARRKHPRRGPKKLLVVVGRQNKGLALPVQSTVGEILRKSGLSKKRGRRR